MEEIRLVVVDDEMSSRSMIKSIIEELPGYRVVADFSNGYKAVSWIKNNQVDIILCDMDMPTINGVELIKLIKMAHDEVSFIAVSGYDSFNYVRGCMQNEVVDYLLKHELTVEKLGAALEMVKDRYRVTRGATNSLFKSGIAIEHRHNFNENTFRSLIDSNTIKLSEAILIPLVISTDYKLNLNSNVQPDYKKICSIIVDVIKELIEDEVSYVYHITEEHNILMLVSYFKVHSYLYATSKTKQLCSKMMSRIDKLLDSQITIGIGEVCSNYDKAISKLNYIEHVTIDKLYGGGNRIINEHSMSQQTYDETYVIKENLVKSLICEIDRQDEGAALKIVKSFYDTAKALKSSRQVIERLTLKLLDILSDTGLVQTNREIEEKKIKQIETFNQYETYILHIYQESIRDNIKNHKEINSPAVIQVVQYILDQYNQDISLEKCSEQVGISYTHMSRLFKSEMGIGFADYVKRVRIDKAKALLHKNESTLREIAEEVGYQNYNYFFKVFKEIEKVTPTAYIHNAKK